MYVCIYVYHVTKKIVTFCHVTKKVTHAARKSLFHFWIKKIFHILDKKMCMLHFYHLTKRGTRAARWFLVYCSQGCGDGGEDGGV